MRQSKYIYENVFATTKQIVFAYLGKARIFIIRKIPIISFSLRLPTNYICESFEEKTKQEDQHKDFEVQIQINYGTSIMHS